VCLDLASLKVMSLDQILLDGKPVSPQLLKTGFLVISEGDHAVRTRRT
jgi:hypothetical protein